MSSQPSPVFAGKKDFAALALLLALSLVAWMIHSSNDKAKKPTIYRIKIFSRPEKVSEITQPPENRLTITGKLGPAEIEWDVDGKVRIASSTCPCKTCVNMGWVSDSSLICVPNGIIIEPQSNGALIDAVTR